MNKFLHWLAVSPLGGVFKVGAGAALAYVLNNISSFNFSPALTPIVIAVVTVAINALNPQDSRYGKVDSNVAD